MRAIRKIEEKFKQRKVDKVRRDEQVDRGKFPELFAELSERLCELTPRRRDLHQSVNTTMDKETFLAMVDARDVAEIRDDFGKLVKFVFMRLSALCSPVRESTIRSDIDELTAALAVSDASDSAALGGPRDVAREFLRRAHGHVDGIEDDVHAYLTAMHGGRPKPAEEETEARENSAESGGGDADKYKGK